MKMTRVDFLKLYRESAAAVGLSSKDLLRLEEVLVNPSLPAVIWLQGTACTRCSESFLNRTSASDPKTAADVLISYINLVYHPTLMVPAGRPNSPENTFQEVKLDHCRARGHFLS